MSLPERPLPFQSLDDELFSRLPATYALMKETAPMALDIAACRARRSGQYICEPPHRPISKMLGARVEEARDER
jgi:hypothetical protein